MRKYIPIICLALILIFPMTSFAATNKNTEKKLKQKITATEKYDQDGTNKMIEEKIKQYYENNEIIDDSKITDLDSVEAQELINKIEKEMIKYSEKKNSTKSVGNYPGTEIHDSNITDTDNSTNSMGSDPVTGTNTINFNSFEDADIILVHDGKCPYGYWRHCGTYEEATGKFISAQIDDQGNGAGVIREPKSFYRGYDEATGQWVNDSDNNTRQEIRGFIMNYLAGQIDDDYGFTAYNDRDKWYCSKLPWVGWKEFYSTNLNANGGLCSPDDLERYTYRFAHSS